MLQAAPNVALPDRATRAVDAVDVLLRDWPLTDEPRRQLAARIVGAVDALMHGAAIGSLSVADVSKVPLQRSGTVTCQTPPYVSNSLPANG